jgi:membrane associated rhomboid family serine protease
MNTPPDGLRKDTERLRRSVFMAMGFTAALWIIKIAEMVFDLSLAEHGIYPLQFMGLKGIVVAPLVHGNLSHLFANTAPLVILGTALLYGYPKSAKIVLPSVYLGTGLCVWLFGRDAYHIGASGLTFGVMFFILTIGILRWDTRAIALSMVVFFLYGSMIWGIFPIDPAVSFESHLAGAAIGVTLAICLKHYDPAPPRKTYSWEEHPEETDLDDGQ